MSLYKPDLVLTQAFESDKMFKTMGCNIKTLNNGVDTNRFISCDSKTKLKLREKYEIDEKKFVILHVGHLIKARNLLILKDLQNQENQVIIVASKHRKWNYKILNELKQSGVIILEGYFKNLEEIYGLSDCYVFPVKVGFSLFTPLTFLEAMSCNLLVISKRFEGLTRFFNEGNGLVFFDDEKDLNKKFKDFKNQKPLTRDMVLSYSWEKVGKELEKIYADVLTVET